MQKVRDLPGLLKKRKYCEDMVYHEKIVYMCVVMKEECRYDGDGSCTCCRLLFVLQYTPVCSMHV